MHARWYLACIAIVIAVFVTTSSKHSGSKTQFASFAPGLLARERARTAELEAEVDRLHTLLASAKHAESCPRGADAHSSSDSDAPKDHGEHPSVVAPSPIDLGDAARGADDEPLKIPHSCPRCVECPDQHTSHPVQASGAAEGTPCCTRDMAKDLIHSLTYEEWYNASIGQLGTFEPYMAILNLDRAHLKALEMRMTWYKTMPCPGVALHQKQARKFLRNVCSKYKEEYTALSKLPVGVEPIHVRPPDQRYYDPDDWPADASPGDVVAHSPSATKEMNRLNLNFTCHDTGKCFDGTQRALYGDEDYAGRIPPDWQAFYQLPKRLRATTARSLAEVDSVQKSGLSDAADPQHDRSDLVEVPGHLGLQKLQAIAQRAHSLNPLAVADAGAAAAAVLTSPLDALTVPVGEDDRQDNAAGDDGLPHRNGNQNRQLLLHDRVANSYNPNNTQFGCVDASTLYCMVRHHKPKRIVEIGAGWSTRVLRVAMRKNAEEGHKPQYISIEPYPDDHLKEVVSEFGTLYDIPMENVPREVFRGLEANDIVFIDTSHILRADNEIIPIYLELLPSLAEGVIVHVHDVYLPQHYRFKYYTLHWFWTEEYLLQALLTFSTAWDIIVGNHYMYYVVRDRETYHEAFDSAYTAQVRVTLYPVFAFQRLRCLPFLSFCCFALRATVQVAVEYRKIWNKQKQIFTPFKYPSPGSMWLRKKHA